MEGWRAGDLRFSHSAIEDGHLAEAEVGERGSAPAQVQQMTSALWQISRSACRLSTLKRFSSALDSSPAPRHTQHAHKPQGMYCTVHLTSAAVHPLTQGLYGTPHVRCCTSAYAGNVPKTSWRDAMHRPPFPFLAEAVGSASVAYEPQRAEWDDSLALDIPEALQSAKAEC